MEPGMYGSDRCDLCHEYGDKARPGICHVCWHVLPSIIAKYGNELGVSTADIAGAIEDLQILESLAEMNIWDAGDIRLARKYIWDALAKLRGEKG